MTIVQSILLRTLYQFWWFLFTRYSRYITEDRVKFYPFDSSQILFCLGHFFLHIGLDLTELSPSFIVHFETLCICSLLSSLCCRLVFFDALLSTCLICRIAFPIVMRLKTLRIRLLIIKSICKPTLHPFIDSFIITRKSKNSKHIHTTDKY